MKNLVERSVVLCDQTLITPKHFTLNCESKFDDTESLNNSREMKMEKVEKNLIIKALKDCNFIKTKAAGKLGISRYALLRKMKKYNIEQ